MPINHRESLIPSLALPSGINTVCHIHRILYTIGIIRTYCQLQFSIIYSSVSNKSKPPHSLVMGRKRISLIMRAAVLKSGSQKMEGNTVHIMHDCSLWLLMLQKSLFKKFSLLCILHNVHIKNQCTLCHGKYCDRSVSQFERNLNSVDKDGFFIHLICHANK